MSLINKYLPYMDNYNYITKDTILPYLMTTGPKNLNNECIRTDNYGFRYSKYQRKLISIKECFELENINILIGGSTVFGVGASNSNNTISSILSEKTGDVWINLGMRACNSLQEYLNLLRIITKFKKIQNIVFYTGINDIYLNLNSKRYEEMDDRFLNEEANLMFYSCKRKLFASIFSKIYKANLVDLVKLSPKEMIFYGIKKPLLEEYTIENKLIKIKEIYTRNFLLYSALKKELNTNISFIQQPFLHWCDKKLSREEIEIISYLSNTKKNKEFNETKKLMNKKVYQYIINMFNDLSKRFNIKFTDSNQYFKDIKTFTFIDSVHLNDYGNIISSEIILRSIK